MDSRTDIKSKQKQQVHNKYVKDQNPAAILSNPKGVKKSTLSPHWTNEAQGVLTEDDTELTEDEDTENESHDFTDHDTISKCDSLDSAEVSTLYLSYICALNFILPYV